MRLQLSVLKPTYQELLDEKVAPAKRNREDLHQLMSEELYTPGGMPIRVEIMLGIREELKVYSASTLLLYSSGVHEYQTLDLWLSTDEVLRIHLHPL